MSTKLDASKYSRLDETDASKVYSILGYGRGEEAYNWQPIEQCHLKFDAIKYCRLDETDASKFYGIFVYLGSGQRFKKSSQ